MSQEDAQSAPRASVDNPEAAVERVVVATNEGPAVDSALRWVAHRAAAHRLDVEVVTVADLDRFIWARSAQAIRQEATELAERTAARLALLAPALDVRVRVLSGDPREQFAAASGTADLIVVGSARVAGIADVVASGFSVKLAEAARCPAIIVPKDWEPNQSGAVLVGLEGDDSDDAAAAFAAHEARVLRRPLRVLHAWTAPAIDGDVDTRLDGLNAWHRGILDEAVAGLSARSPDITIDGDLVEGPQAYALLEASKGAELLVVGAHRRGRLERFFLGSISRSILMHPRCPVALVRPGS
jgi:nucleotide-binding universal stress UspA family protein